MLLTKLSDEIDTRLKRLASSGPVQVKGSVTIPDGHISILFYPSQMAYKLMLEHKMVGKKELPGDWDDFAGAYKAAHEEAKKFKKK